MSEREQNNDKLPDDIRNALLAMGAAEWGAVGPKDDVAHVSDTADALAATREHFKLEGPQQMHGVYVAGSEIAIALTGTSPNSANHARIIVGAWNWLLAKAESERLDEMRAMEATQADRLGGCLGD